MLFATSSGQWRTTETLQLMLRDVHLWSFSFTYFSYTYLPILTYTLPKIMMTLSFTPRVTGILTMQCAPAVGRKWGVCKLHYIHKGDPPTLPHVPHITRTTCLFMHAHAHMTAYIHTCITWLLTHTHACMACLFTPHMHEMPVYTHQRMECSWSGGIQKWATKDGLLDCLCVLYAHTYCIVGIHYPDFPLLQHCSILWPCTLHILLLGRQHSALETDQ